MSMKELRARLGLRSPIEKHNEETALRASLHDLHEKTAHLEAELAVVRDHRDALLDAAEAYEHNEQALIEENRQLRARLELALKDVEDLREDGAYLEAYREMY